MSILNVHVEKDRALIAVNTEGVHPDGRKTGNAPKIFVLAHTNAVLAFSGPVAVGLRVYFDCCSSLLGLDDLFKTFEGHFKARCTEFQKEAAAAGQPLLHNANCVLIGWSPTWKEVVGIQCSHIDTFSTRLAGSSLAPLEESWPAPPCGWPSTHAEMIATAKYQSHHAELQWPAHACCRGDLVMAEVTEGSILFTEAREFWR